MTDAEAYGPHLQLDLEQARTHHFLHTGKTVGLRQIFHGRQGNSEAHSVACLQLGQIRAHLLIGEQGQSTFVLLFAPSLRLIF